MKKYILLALLLAPLSFSSIHGYGCCGGGSGAGWGVGAGLLGLGLGTAIASRPRRETVVIEKEAPAQKEVVYVDSATGRVMQAPTQEKVVYVDSKTGRVVSAPEPSDYEVAYS